MELKFKKIYDKKIVHSSFLDKETVEELMIDSYNLGVYDVLDWLKKNDHLSNNIDYLIEEYKNQNL